MRLIVLLAAISVMPLAFAQDSRVQADAPVADPLMLKYLGELPAPGDINDILICAGANEVLWTEAMGTDPYDPGANEAKRKAGWYAAVALWVFAVDSEAVIDAISKARKQTPRTKTLETARRCRKAPDGWRD